DAPHRWPHALAPGNRPSSQPFPAVVSGDRALRLRSVVRPSCHLRLSTGPISVGDGQHANGGQLYRRTRTLCLGTQNRLSTSLGESNRWSECPRSGWRHLATDLAACPKTPLLVAFHLYGPCEVAIKHAYPESRSRSARDVCNRRCQPSELSHTFG